MTAPHTAHLALARNIRRLCHEQSKRMQDIAASAGIGREHLSRVINYQAFPSFSSLLGLAAALEVEPFELLRPHGPELSVASSVPGVWSVSNTLRADGDSVIVSEVVTALDGSPVATCSRVIGLVQAVHALLNITREELESIEARIGPEVEQ